MVTDWISIDAVGIRNSNSRFLTQHNSDQSEYWILTSAVFNYQVPNRYLAASFRNMIEPVLLPKWNFQWPPIPWVISKVMSSGHLETPKKVYKVSESVILSCYRLCKSVGVDTSHWQNLYSKGNLQYYFWQWSRSFMVTYFHEVNFCLVWPW